MGEWADDESGRCCRMYRVMSVRKLLRRTGEGGACPFDAEADSVGGEDGDVSVRSGMRRR
jgi:hypothetical protein